jgi:multiple antibiotic resistance protein
MDQLKGIFHFKDIFSVSLILFSIIDILGALPAVIEVRKRTGHIHSERATLVAGAIMISFLYLGDQILKLFGVDVASFALAGALVIFLMGLEMILDRNIFKNHTTDRLESAGASSASSASSIVPIAFPLIAGAGTMTTILSLRVQYGSPDILVGILLNLVFVYIVLKSSAAIERVLGRGGSDVLRKVFGVILLAIAIRIIKTYFAVNLT